MEASDAPSAAQCAHETRRRTRHGDVCRKGEWPAFHVVVLAPIGFVTRETKRETNVRFIGAKTVPPSHGMRGLKVKHKNRRG